MSADAVATALVWLAGLYAACGLLFALVFLVRGVERLDPAARESSLGFRLVILPGVVALWPLLAGRWRAWRRSDREGPPIESNAHRRAAGSGS
jgi:hypothetical protein